MACSKYLQDYRGTPVKKIFCINKSYYLQLTAHKVFHTDCPSTTAVLQMRVRYCLGHIPVTFSNFFIVVILFIIILSYIVYVLTKCTYKHKYVKIYQGKHRISTYIQTNFTIPNHKMMERAGLYTEVVTRHIKTSFLPRP